MVAMSGNCDWPRALTSGRLEGSCSSSQNPLAPGSETTVGRAFHFGQCSDTTEQLGLDFRHGFNPNLNMRVARSGCRRRCRSCRQQLFNNMPRLKQLELNSLSRNRQKAKAEFVMVRYRPLPQQSSHRKVWSSKIGHIELIIESLVVSKFWLAHVEISLFRTVPGW
jgi:hypothetical protein